MTAAAATKSNKKAAQSGPKNKPAGRKDAKAAELTQEVEAAQKLMPPALLAEVEDCRKIIDQSDETQVREKYSVGRRLNEILADDTGRYGTNPGPLIMSAMAYKRDTVKAVMRVAKTFRPNQLQQLLSIRHPVTKETLTWSHIAPLSRVEEFDKAKAIAEDAVHRGLSSKELVKAVTLALGGKKSAGGRKQKTPQGLEAFLADVQAKTGFWMNAADKVWFGGTGLESAFSAEAKKGISAATVSRLEDTVAAVDELGTKVRLAGAELNKLLTRARGPRSAAG